LPLDGGLEKGKRKGYHKGKTGKSRYITREGVILNEHKSQVKSGMKKGMKDKMENQDNRKKAK